MSTDRCFLCGCPVTYWQNAHGDWVLRDAFDMFKGMFTSNMVHEASCGVIKLRFYLWHFAQRGDLDAAAVLERYFHGA